ncbi:MAG: hypothetical protein JXR46_15130 [Calditrichaceae bacterium]|nr:hypothetical protein [Calditrichaceae bacterium]MBN2710375.1 hypothetical protein [Calditrichaceae bacterium]
MSIQQKLEEKIGPLCKELNLYLLEVKIKGERRHPVFQVYVDNEKGVTLGECEKLTRMIQDEIDMDDDFNVNYRLDVSSPGVGHPLKYDFEYKKNIGRLLAVSLNENGEELSVEGILKEITEKALVLEIKNESKEILRENVKQAKVKVQW